MSPLRRRNLVSLIAAMLLSACATTKDKEPDAPPAAKESREAPKAAAPAPAQPDKAQQELSGGIDSYENGAYKTAARQLQSALALGLEGRANRAKAHKYLAFMHCVGKRERQCRDEFRKALDSDPAFDLSPAEAGHPTWGPVFRKLKVATKPAKK
ncbi:TssQ family T6SS-associated lipoprotein [Dechloromonas sp. A34]|uniref:TssQ family T6SS-associated lipoprotein n=1 Tax=Dechloromonas sp. A34 TaxID=447588 RepID=UPI0022497760|nr:TssQ family T6SS-associated lipoprotein [Dechloromonas sp. A34]